MKKIKYKIYKKNKTEFTFSLFSRIDFFSDFLFENGIFHYDKTRWSVNGVYQYYESLNS